MKLKDGLTLSDLYCARMLLYQKMDTCRMNISAYSLDNTAPWEEEFEKVELQLIRVEDELYKRIEDMWVKE